MTDDETRLMLRLPPDLADSIRTLATEQERSINGQIVFMLRSCLKPYRKRQQRGTRIPEPWVVTEEMKTWVTENCPDVDGPLENRQFVNYWQARAGAGAVKLNWRRTWENRMLEVQKKADQRHDKPSTTSLRVAAGKQLAQKYRERGE